MKRYLHALAMCMSTFCALPSPFRIWDEDARPLMSLFLPLVGLLTGGLWTLTAYLTRPLALPPLVCGAVLCAFPFLITGGIHMDGFMDVVDAVKSRRPLEERRKILKDPHVGSFAVLASILLITVQFALFASAKSGANLFALILIAVASRTVAALCVSLLRPMPTSEYSGAYRRGVNKPQTVVLFAILALCIALGFVFSGKYGFAPLAVTAGYLLSAFFAFRSLGGMSGDVSGYALTVGELCGIAVYALI